MSKWCLKIRLVYYVYKQFASPMYRNGRRRDMSYHHRYSQLCRNIDKVWFVSDK